MDSVEKRPLMISRGWIQAAMVVLMFAFLILGILTYYTYNDQPPIPQLVKTPRGSTLFTREDIMSGQQIFLGNGLMEYGFGVVTHARRHRVIELFRSGSVYARTMVITALILLCGFIWRLGEEFIVGRMKEAE